ncbi:hypothetical protein TNCT_249511 [Trichonephila clavata]|uniref:Uncharacterized protein n=1 Tax=Trichonephila clavata TaxID=2740835 RepID=A0A8X6LH46_TRICU|nr:hypothetical protein TNCT_249511 [Trichonephila clavata]
MSKLLFSPSQGKAMDCAVTAPAGSHFIADGRYTRFADWRFVHKGWLNLVPLNANKKGTPALRACRKCGKGDETLSRVKTLLFLFCGRANEAQLNPRKN